MTFSKIFVPRYEIRVRSKRILLFVTEFRANQRSVLVELHYQVIMIVIHKQLYFYFGK